MSDNKTFHINKTHVIAWANVSKKGQPKKMYIGDSVVDFERVDPASYEPIQTDSKYIFFSLELDAEGQIYIAPTPEPAVAAPVATPELAPATA